MYTVYADKLDGNGLQWHGEHTRKGIAVSSAISLAETYGYRVIVRLGAVLTVWRSYPAPEYPHE
jgi:hypothetical protein